MPNARTSKAPSGRGRGKRTSPRKKPQTSLPLKKRATAKPAQQSVDSPDEENLNTTVRTVYGTSLNPVMLLAPPGIAKAKCLL